MRRESTLARLLYDKAEAGFVPLNMMLELTYRCNQQCLHCYLPETQGARDPRRNEELAAGEWCRVLDELAKAGTMFLILSGGEVLLRPDLGEIIRQARRLLFSVEIFTNGTLLTPQTADSWAELGISRVSVSVYSPVAARHDRVARLAGSFERILRGVRLLRQRGIRVRLKTPLMKLNFADREALRSLAGRLGAELQFDPMLVPRDDGVKAPVRLGLTGGRLRQAYQDPLLAPAQTVMHARPLNPFEPTCGAGRTSGAINPFGEVLPCIQWAVPAGNVRKRPFAEIWRDGRVLIESRRACGRDVRPCPICAGSHFVHCLGLSQLEHGDPLVPDSGSCGISRAIREIQEEHEKEKKEETLQEPVL